MSVRTFFLPNGNRIDIDDRRTDSSANGVIDGHDRIRINGHEISLGRIQYLPPENPQRQAWEFLRRELGVSALRGVNLSRASQIFGLREQARYLLTRPNPTREESRAIRGFIDAANELGRLTGFASVSEAGLRALSSSLPEAVFPRWAALDCLWNSGWAFCVTGESRSEERQIRESGARNRRIQIDIPSSH